MDLDFYEKHEEEKRRKLKIFSSIKELFSGDNSSILFALHKKEILEVSSSDLEKCGFDGIVLVASNSLLEDPLMGRISYYSINHFKGYDLRLKNDNLFEIIKTDNSDIKVLQLIKIRNKKLEIESFKYASSAYIEDWEIRNEALSQDFNKKAKFAEQELLILIKELENIK